MNLLGEAAIGEVGRDGAQVQFSQESLAATGFFSVSSSFSGLAQPEVKPPPPDTQVAVSLT